MTESNLLFERIHNGQIERRGIIKKGLDISEHRSRMRLSDKEKPGTEWYYVGAWFRKQI